MERSTEVTAVGTEENWCGRLDEGNAHIIKHLSWTAVGAHCSLSSSCQHTDTSLLMDACGLPWDGQGDVQFFL